jgi:hypothetical protein
LFRLAHKAFPLTRSAKAGLPCLRLNQYWLCGTWDST